MHSHYNPNIAKELIGHHKHVERVYDMFAIARCSSLKDSNIMSTLTLPQDCPIPESRTFLLSVSAESLD